MTNNNMLGGVYILLAMMLVLGGLMARREPGLKLAKMALAWVLRGGRVTSALIGASRVSQVEDCVGALSNLDFTDAALVSPLVEGPQRRWMRWGPIDGARGLRITADLVRAFFDHTLLDRPADALLVRPEATYPELRIMTGTPVEGP